MYVGSICQAFTDMWLGLREFFLITPPPPPPPKKKNEKKKRNIWLVLVSNLLIGQIFMI